MKRNVQSEATVNSSTEKQAQSSLSGNRKAPGTRVGLLIDWRSASGKPARVSGRYGRALRDGR